MTPQAINEAIAKDQGWQRLEQPESVCVGTRTDRYGQKFLRHEARMMVSWQTPDGKDRRAQPPNYHGDLNAMHEVENKLSDEEFNRYCITLCGLCVMGCYPATIDELRKGVSATSAQRAEAYLRVKGLWKE